MPCASTSIATCPAPLRPPPSTTRPEPSCRPSPPARRLLVYQGVADPVFSARDLVAHWQDSPATTAVPPSRSGRACSWCAGMTHCGGGPALDDFDPLAAIESWVERGRGAGPPHGQGHRLPGRPGRSARSPGKRATRAARSGAGRELFLQGGRDAAPPIKPARAGWGRRGAAALRRRADLALRWGRDPHSRIREGPRDAGRFRPPDVDEDTA